MKEEMVSTIRKRSDKGTITYSLPPEKKRVMNDDRNYVAIMCILWLKMLRDKEVLGESQGLDVIKAYTKHKTNDFTSNEAHDLANTNPFLGGFKGRGAGNRQGKTPFTGTNPFTEK